MKKSKKRKVTKRNLVIIGFSVLLLVILTCFIKRTYFVRPEVLYMTEDWNGDPSMEFQKKAPKHDWYCPDLKSIISKVSRAVQIKQIEVLNKNNRTFGLVVKMTNDGPFLGLNADESINMILKKGNYMDVDYAIKRIVFPKLKGRGFSDEPLASSQYTTPARGWADIPEGEQGSKWINRAIRKDNFIYVFSYYYRENERIYITCGAIGNDDFDLLARVLSIKRYSTWKPNTSLQVWEDKGNAFMLNIMTQGFGSGSGEWWAQKPDSTWVLLAAQQDYPECYLFERMKVGRGIRCYNVNTKGEYAESTVTY